MTPRVKAVRSAVVLTLAIAIFWLPLQVLAVDYGGGSIQTYRSDSPIDNGSVVVLKNSEQKLVSLAQQDDMQNMFGVTVDHQQLPLRISGGEENEVHVAVSGTYNVLVSTQGGNIVAGDFVTLSSINGVAMKAGTEELTVFGRAAAGFDGTGVVLSTTTLKDENGDDNQTVKLGSIPVTIDIRQNPNEKTTKAKVPEALERIGQAIAEKEVDPIRIYLSMVIAAVSLMASIIVIYAGVKNSIISIGRNPMSKKSIFRALLEIILTSILILIIGLFAVYLLLKL